MFLCHLCAFVPYHQIIHRKDVLQPQRMENPLTTFLELMQQHVIMVVVVLMMMFSFCDIISALQVQRRNSFIFRSHCVCKTLPLTCTVRCVRFRDANRRGIGFAAAVFAIFVVLFGSYIYLFVEDGTNRLLFAFGFPSNNVLESPYRVLFALLYGDSILYAIRVHKVFLPKLLDFLLGVPIIQSEPVRNVFDLVKDNESSTMLIVVFVF